MLSPQIGFLLKDWRKAHGIKQESLAAILGVSQSAISHWENGLDIPHRRLVGRIVDMITDASKDRLFVDRLAIQQTDTIRACFDLDGVKLVTGSNGLAKAWPEFSRLIDKRLVERLVGEASQFLHDDDFVRSARRGEIALVSAVSDRHIQQEVDSAFRHRWTAVFRSYGAKVLVDMTYETCDPLSDTGIQSIVPYDSVAG